MADPIPSMDGLWATVLALGAGVLGLGAKILRDVVRDWRRDGTDQPATVHEVHAMRDAILGEFREFRASFLEWRDGVDDTVGRNRERVSQIADGVQSLQTRVSVIEALAKNREHRRQPGGGET